jgi:23S rRNA C2498 (ribose-2'-O)-methylase RlmM
MDSRKDVMSLELGEIIFAKQNQSNSEMLRNIPESDKLLFLMRQYDSILQMGPDIQLADSMSFYNIQKEVKIDVNIDSIFNVGIGKPLFVAALVCYESGQCNYE